MKINQILFLLALLTLKAGAQSPALVIADSLHSVGNYTQVVQILDTITPSTEAVKVRLAKAYRAKGQLDQAKKYYKEVLDKNPDRVLIAVEYANLLMKTGDFKLSEIMFLALSKNYPENANFQYRMGLAKEKQKDSTALVHFYNTIELDPTHQQGLYKISKHALNNKKYEIAEKFSKQGLEVYSENTSLLSVFAQALYQQDKYRLAVETFEKLVELGKGSENVHSSLAMAFYQLEELESSIQHYLKALEYNDKNPGLHHNLGRLYALVGELEKSETHLLIALVLKKKPVDAEYLSLALTYKLQEDYKKTLEYLNLALEENPENERALYERAIAADNYFKDLQTKINFYQTYITKYENKGDEAMLILAKNRYSMLRKELHLSE